jgi:hypothetical protein
LRTPLFCALAATLVGCTGSSPPHAGTSRTDASGLACFDRTADRQPIEPMPVSSKTISAPLQIKPAVVAKVKTPSSAAAHNEYHLATKTEKPTTIAAKNDLSASRNPLPPRSSDTLLQPATSGAAADTTDQLATTGAVANTRTIQEQVAAATAVAELMTIASLIPVLEPRANSEGPSDYAESVLRNEKTSHPQANTTDLLVLLLARPEINSVSDLTSKTVAIDEGRSGSPNGNVRTAIAAAGAPDVLLISSQRQAIDRVISGEVPAAVLTLVSAEAAEVFPDIAGFKIFRIPLSPSPLRARP